jgi:hypothetical protein
MQDKTGIATLNSAVDAVEVASEQEAGIRALYAEFLPGSAAEISLIPLEIPSGWTYKQAHASRQFGCATSVEVFSMLRARCPPVSLLNGGGRTTLRSYRPVASWAVCPAFRSSASASWTRRG